MLTHFVGAPESQEGLKHCQIHVDEGNSEPERPESQEGLKPRPRPVAHVRASGKPESQEGLKLPPPPGLSLQARPPGPESQEGLKHLPRACARGLRAAASVESQEGLKRYNPIVVLVFLGNVLNLKRG